MNSSFNRLATETSPYLLQHATNPVQWFPWGPEAFTKAEQEKKLMLISIGYSSCHWCHVMEKETFSNAEVAEFMNDHYVCVKVDREERPDVDQIYMNAVQIINRSGGWPLNCFTLPDGRPVYGGTYFRPEHWLDILKSLHSTWISNPERVVEVADELTEGIANTGIVKAKKKVDPFSAEKLNTYVENWSKYFDKKFGANKGAPKFPMPGSLKFLLDFSWFFINNYVNQHVKLTLDKMRLGGIYDHLGGGFFRYSVDDHWRVPHFEKMLYDNAQLINLYTHAFKHFKDENYRRIVYQTVDFLNREMRSPEGGFYSALDADSEGEEGKFYTFTKRDIDGILGADAELFSIAYGISASGSHLEKNVLCRSASDNEVACLLGIEPDQVAERLKLAKIKLFNARATRVHPINDDKQLTAWNAMAIYALVNAHLVFGDKQFLNHALKCARFIEENLMDSNGKILRVFCKGKASISGFLDDYAYLIEAYISLYKATFQEKWLLKANNLMEQALSSFYDKESGMFYYTSTDHNNQIVRKMELTDGVIPSSSAVMAENLMELAVYFRNHEFTAMASQMISNIEEQFQVGGPYTYRWANSYLKRLIGQVDLQSSGEEVISKLKSIMGISMYPFIIPCITDTASKIPLLNANIENNTFKICHANSCHPPAKDTQEVIDAIKSLKFVE